MYHGLLLVAVFVVNLKRTFQLHSQSIESDGEVTPARALGTAAVAEENWLINLKSCKKQMTYPKCGAKACLFVLSLTSDSAQYASY